VTWWQKGRVPGRPSGDPFAALGLAAATGLTDDDVRAAWRRVAAATHPDRADGGDPARFAEAAAAYTTLRTRSGRGEALADAATAPARRTARAGEFPVTNGISRLWPRASAPFSRRRPRSVSALVTRIRRGRPGRLAVRVLAAGAASAVAVVVAGSRPAGPALVAGVVTWLLITAHRDLAPPR
jgi:curved DNA-binding protein CbpA